MKTPEELAEELDRQAVLYVSLKARNDVSYYVGMDCYKAGYQAAQEQQEKEWGALVSKGRIAMQTLNDQVADADKVMNFPENPDDCDHILDMEKMVDVNGWISVKDRLPEDAAEVLIAFGGGVSIACYGGDWRHPVYPMLPLLSVTHWMPLPAAPKE
jgi:hypothetical protein